MKPVFDQFNLKSMIDILAGKMYSDLGLISCTSTIDLTPKAGGETIHAMPDSKALTLYERQPNDS
jgi:hypothetical protein